MDRGTQQFFGAESGLAGGPVQEIYQDGSGAVWVGSGEGLSRYRNGRWTSWGVRQGLPEGVQGITATAEGDLWLLTAAGLLRLSGTELSNTPDSSPSNLSFRVYGPLDGIQFSASRRMVNPRLAQSPDGRVWISTDDGLSTLDPKRLRNNPVAPPVNIEQILVDGRALDISSGTSEFRGRELEIQFAALNLGLPQAVDVRYRLEGFDRDWHLIKGPMRIAYERLPPGNYRFRVVASNPDGVWNNAGATINLRRVPEFYQTIPFQAACVLAVAGMVYAAHRLRMRVLHGRLRLVLRERIRIARELHDTLLQGFAGAVYLIKGASLQSEISPEEGRQRLNSAIDKANQSLKEARHVLACLRLTELENHTLSQALEAAGRSMVSGTSILFRMEVTGRVPELPYEIESELYIVAREAMSNAAAHAAPAHIYLKLAFSPAQIRMSIQDDGIGFEVQEALAKKDHWGLMGMQERVKAIHAAITIDSQPSHGTRIGVAAPLRAARIGHANSRW